MRSLAWSIALGSTLACGGEPAAPPFNTPPPVVRPERVEALTAEIQRFALPVELRDASLAVSTLEGTGTLIGGDGGLFLISGGAIAAVDAAPVTALASVEGAGIVVGRPDGVSLWNGTLLESPLTDAIGSMPVKALLEKTGALFLGTDSSLFLLENNELYEFDEIDGASRLAGYAAGPTLVIDDQLVLKSGATGWSLQDLADELAAESAIPAAGDRLFAADGGELLERIQVDGGAVWRKVALSTDESDPGAYGITAMAPDPISGNAWVVSADQIARIAGSAVATMAYPADLGAPIAVRATADGALWISDGNALARFGDDAGPSTYAKDIAAFSANNCERCHRPLGVGHPLDSFEAWRTEADNIIAQLEQMKMPQDGASLVGGTVELIKTWKTDGLLP